MVTSSSHSPHSLHSPQDSHSSNSSSPSPAPTPDSNKLAEAQDVFSKALQRVAVRYTAFMPIISAFRVAYLDVIPTMGVDKYARLIINPDFLVENAQYAQGLIMHEILHVFFGHTSNARAKLTYTEDPNLNYLINVAEDCAINQFIPEPLPGNAITPRVLREALHTDDCINSFADAEYYYDYILQHRPLQSNNSALPQGNPCATDKMNTQEMQDTLDKLGVKHVSQEEVNDAQMSSAQNVVNGKGIDSQMGSLVDFARTLLEPKVDWRPLLRTSINSAEHATFRLRQHQTYKRTSRRSSSVSSHILLPRRYGHKLSVVISFDTSGSISSEQVSQFLAEVQNCLKFSEIKECALWHTNTYWYGTSTQLQQNISKVFQAGGTDSACVEQCAQHTKADLGFTFTDGKWGADPRKPQGCKVNSMVAIIWNGKDIKEIRKLW